MVELGVLGAPSLQGGETGTKECPLKHAHAVKLSGGSAMNTVVGTLSGMISELVGCLVCTIYLVP